MILTIIHFGCGYAAIGRLRAKELVTGLTLNFNLMSGYCI